MIDRKILEREYNEKIKEELIEKVGKLREQINQWKRS